MLAADPGLWPSFLDRTGWPAGLLERTGVVRLPVTLREQLGTSDRTPPIQTEVWIQDGASILVDMPPVNAADDELRRTNTVLVLEKSEERLRLFVWSPYFEDPRLVLTLWPAFGIDEVAR